MDGSVCAVVLNWMDAERTVRCVHSLLGSHLVGAVLIVDNESHGGLRGELDVDRRVQVIENPVNLGFSAGVNSALHVALTLPQTHVLVINNDAIIDPSDLLTLYLGTVNYGARSIFAPIVRNPDGTIQSRGERFNPWTFSVRSVEKGRSPDFLTWACVLIPREVLLEVGLLDERFFMYWEDVEYGIRARSRGVRLVTIDSATVVHELSASHRRAGERIDLYSAFGVVRLARLAPLRYGIGASVRIAARVAARCSRRDWRSARAVLAGSARGVRAHASGYRALQDLLG